jgi:hypothetical protein
LAVAVGSNHFIRSLFLLACLSLSSCGTYYFGKNKLVTKFNYDTIPPAIYSFEQYTTANDYTSDHPLISHWAEQPLPDWSIEGKVSAARIMIAKLLQGKDVKAVNDYILSKKKPWGKSGTDWALNPNGDYDFTETTLCHLLWMFNDKPELLFPETKKHLATVLLIHSGNKPELKAPRSLKIMSETENHIFMSETTRYLKNQWLRENGDTSKQYDNQRNGLEKWLLNHLEEKFRAGFFEFNAQPYSGYTLSPLLTLFTFAKSTEMKKQCDKLLTRMVIEYSYSALDLRRYPPFRRRLEREKVKTFDEDPLTGMLKLWLSLNPENKVEQGDKLKHFAFMALISNYRPNKELTQLLLNKEACFVALSHGVKASPEIYSARNNYLLSSGGAQPAKISQIVAHPIVLFLKDNVQSLDSCFYLSDKGKMRKWNNTGVYKNFACANQPVHIPPHYQALAEKENWKIFKPEGSDIFILTYSNKNCGLLFVTPKQEAPEKVLNEMILKNEKLNLSETAITPDNDTITFQLNAPKNRWVIKSVNSKPSDRKFNHWKKITQYQ